MKGVLISAACLLGCAGGSVGSAADQDSCPEDPTLYSYRDTTRGVTLPYVIRSSMPRAGFGRITAQGIIAPNGRVERGTVRTFGSGYPDERVAAGDALFWSRFGPATRDGCAVRFLYRVTYMAGIPQRVPDDTTTVEGGRRR